MIYVSMACRTGRVDIRLAVTVTIAVLTIIAVLSLWLPRSYCKYGRLGDFRTNDGSTAELAAALRAQAGDDSTYVNCETVEASDWDASNAYLLLTNFSLQEWLSILPSDVQLRPVGETGVSPRFAIKKQLSNPEYYQLSQGGSELPGQIKYIVSGTVDGKSSTLVAYVSSDGLPSL
jgi:hypothetical protein